MHTSSLLSRGIPRPRAAPNLSICWRCQLGGLRAITQRHLERKEEGKTQWAEFAKQIKNGTRKSMLMTLEERGYIKEIAGDRDVFEKLMNKKRLGVYVGVDPTAPSLHVGHLLPLMALFWMYLHGFHAVSLLGASTAKIGDPTGRTTSRPQLTNVERKANLTSMHYQLKRIWQNLEKVGEKHGFMESVHWKREIVNNATWWNKVPFYDVLKFMGTGLRIGTMLGRDTVKTKMESGEGVSFAEFCYPVMQAWDWWRMYDEKGIQVQIGGQDQYGNIVAGIDAVKHVLRTHPDPDIRLADGESIGDKEPFGFTVPLLTTSTGEKFGKSAGNAIWLDQNLTNLYDLYGFLVRTADADVERYLKLFTFLPINKIQSIADKHASDPSKRLAQHMLAREFIELIHGAEAAKQASEQHASMRSQTLSSLTSSMTTPEAVQHPPQSTVPPTQQPATNPLLENQNADTRRRGTYISPSLNPYAPQTNQNSNATIHITLPKSIIHNQPISRVLFAAGLVSSRSEGHRLAANQGAYIGHQSNARDMMNDQLSYTPAKLHDPSQTWSYVIRDEVGKEGAPGAMHTEGEEGLLILRVGKWKIRLVRVVSDELFGTLGLEDPPGWAEWKAQQLARSGEASAKTQPGRREDTASRVAGWSSAVEDAEIDPDDWDKHEFEKTPAKGVRRKAAYGALREQQDRGMQFFRERGASEATLRDSRWQDWHKDDQRHGRRRQDSR